MSEEELVQQKNKPLTNLYITEDAAKAYVGLQKQININNGEVDEEKLREHVEKILNSDEGWEIINPVDFSGLKTRDRIRYTTIRDGKHYFRTGGWVISVEDDYLVYRSHTQHNFSLQKEHCGMLLVIRKEKAKPSEKAKIRREKIAKEKAEAKEKGIVYVPKKRRIKKTIEDILEYMAKRDSGQLEQEIIESRKKTEFDRVSKSSKKSNNSRALRRKEKSISLGTLSFGKFKKSIKKSSSGETVKNQEQDQENQENQNQENQDQGQETKIIKSIVYFDKPNEETKYSSFLEKNGMLIRLKSFRDNGGRRRFESSKKYLSVINGESTWEFK